MEKGNFGLFGFLGIFFLTLVLSVGNVWAHDRTSFGFHMHGPNGGIHFSSVRHSHGHRRYYGHHRPYLRPHVRHHVRHHIHHRVIRHYHYHPPVRVYHYSYDYYGGWGGPIYRHEGRRYEYDYPCGPVYVIPSGPSVYYSY
jgi:hypothetical protein